VGPQGPAGPGTGFVRTRTEKAGTEKTAFYALGRGTEYYDMPLIRSIVREADAKNDRFSTLILGIVKSEPFQVNQKQEITSNGQGTIAAR